MTLVSVSPNFVSLSSSLHFDVHISFPLTLKVGDIWISKYPSSVSMQWFNMNVTLHFRVIIPPKRCTLTSVVILGYVINGTWRCAKWVIWKPFLEHNTVHSILILHHLVRLRYLWILYQLKLLILLHRKHKLFYECSINHTIVRKVNSGSIKEIHT